MGLFSRRRTSAPGAPEAFWRTPPFRTGDPEVLYQGGISAVVASDGPKMLAIGWELWGTTGLHQHQSADFLRDGLKEWREAGADPLEQLAFLRDCFERVQGAGPPVPADIHSAPPAVVEPAAAHQSFRCYVASELVEVVASVDPTGLPAIERSAYQAIASSHRAFVPPRSMVWAQAHASRNGMPPPWG